MLQAVRLFCVWALLSTATWASAAPEGQTATGPAKVVIGAYINDIHNIDLANNKHYDDLYIWFRWKDTKQDPTTGIDFMNWTDATDHSNIKQYDPPKPQPDGGFYTILHHQGAFASKFSLENYPFDHQQLNIEIEDSQLGVAERVFVQDSIPVMLDPVIHLPGYEIGTPSLVVRPNKYRIHFGDQSADAADTYSRATIIIPVRRPWVSGVFKVLLPIGLILISAILGLAVRPDHVEARIGLGITALLTMVALQFTSSSNLPEVSYLMLIDKVYIASYMVIIAVLGAVVHDSWYIEGRGVDAVARWNKRAIVLLVLTYLTYVTSIVWNAAAP